MGLDHGWHYETITFLRGMETLEKNTKVIIPTKTVYFFIEKIPGDYAVSYAKSGQSISRKGASRRRKIVRDFQNVLLGTGVYGALSE